MLNEKKTQTNRKHKHKMKKGDMEMSSIKLQFVNICCNNHMLSKQIMWTFKTRLDAKRKEKGDKQTKRDKEPHYEQIS